MVLDRPPIVAQCDRERVLSSWAQYCGNVAPKEFQVQFMSVRHLSPRQFVEKLAKELGVYGVVAGILKAISTLRILFISILSNKNLIWVI